MKTRSGWRKGNFANTGSSLHKFEMRRKLAELFTNPLIIDKLVEFLSVKELKNLRLAFPAYSSYFIQSLVRRAPFNVNNYTSTYFNSPLHENFLGSIVIEGSPLKRVLNNSQRFIQMYSGQIEKITFKENWCLNTALLSAKLFCHKWSSLSKVVVEIESVKIVPHFPRIGEPFPNLRILEIVNEKLERNFVEGLERLTLAIVSRSPELRNLKLGVNLSVNLSSSSVKILTLQIDGRAENTYSALKLNEMMRSASPLLSKLKVCGVGGRSRLIETEQIFIPSMNNLKSLSLLVGSTGFVIGSRNCIKPFPSLQSMTITCSELGGLARKVSWPQLSKFKIIGIDLNLLTNLRGLPSSFLRTTIQVYCRESDKVDGLEQALIFLSSTKFLTYVKLSNTMFEIQNLVEGGTVEVISLPWNWPIGMENRHKDFFLLQRNFWMERMGRNARTK